MKNFSPLAACSLAVIVVSLCLTATAQEKPKSNSSRTWTSVNGNTIEGAFVREEGGKVYIQRPDGSMVGTTREKLSPLDLAWIDNAAAPSNTVKTLTFTLATQLEKNKMEEHRRVKRIIIKTYTLLTNNDRDDKMLFFLQRDALPVFGWTAVSADCYLTKSGKKGKIKEMTFLPQNPVELREAVQMVRDKFVLVMPDPVVVKEVTFDGEPYWEVQSPPEYVSRVLLLVDPETKKIKRFDLKFPPPEK